MLYEIAVRARNMIWRYPLGGAENVTLNWLSRFRRIKVHMIPVVDDIYVRMCFNGKVSREEVEEIAKGQPFSYDQDILSMYLDCKLHLDPGGYRKLDYNYVFDPVLFPDTLPLRKQFSKETGNPLVSYALKKGSILISSLIGIGDINLTNTYLLKNAFYMSLYGGLSDNLLLKFLYLRTIERHLFLNLRKYKDRVLLLSTSEGVKDKLPKGMEAKVVFPHFALDEDVRKYKTSDKCDYAVFFARVTTLKGIYEAIRAFKLIKGENIKSLLVIGENFSSARSEEDVQFLGRIKDRQEVYKIISHARVSIYPSHSDAFGISVLETLGVGTPVSMYYNPANYEYFSKSKMVKIAREYDVKGLARNALELNYNDDEYTDSLISSHLNWETVAQKIEGIITKWLEGKSQTW